MAGYGVAIKNSFLNLVPQRGTDWRFKSPPHPIHTRWRQAMKRLITIILLATTLTANCQIKSLTIETQEADEPPTKQGRPKYSMEFIRNKHGDLETSFFKVDNKRRALKPVVIEKSRLDTLSKWLIVNKRDFKISEFYTDEKIHLQYFNDSQYRLNIPIQGNILIQTDSFTFCQNHRNIQRTLSNGGYSFMTTIKFVDNSKRIFRFESGDIGEHKFDLLNYLYLYRLLNDKLPDNFPEYQLFSVDFFENFIAYYIQTIECEEYYYKEFKKLHPDRSARQNRMRDGWDYLKFLKDKGVID
jgi:hypothetical protein